MGEKLGMLASTLGRGSNSGSSSTRALRIHNDLVFFSERLLEPPSVGSGDEAERGGSLGDNAGGPTDVLRESMSKLRRFLGSLTFSDILPRIEDERRGACSNDVRDGDGGKGIDVGDKGGWWGTTTNWADAKGASSFNVGEVLAELMNPTEREGEEGIELRLSDNGSISVPGLVYSESLAFGNGIP